MLKARGLVLRVLEWVWDSKPMICLVVKQRGTRLNKVLDNVAFISRFTML